MQEHLVAEPKRVHSYHKPTQYLFEDPHTYHYSMALPCAAAAASAATVVVVVVAVVAAAAADMDPAVDAASVAAAVDAAAAAGEEEQLARQLDADLDLETVEEADRLTED